MNESAPEGARLLPAPKSSSGWEDELSTDFEDGARKRLRRNRGLATGLLAAAALIFAATLFVPEPGFWVLLVRTAAEAGMIGGVADWFAVTALFRRPLGLPIPHTAIIPNNKERMGRALGRFVERNFLTPEVLITRLRDARPSRQLAGWLAQPGSAELVSGSIGATLPYIVHSLNSPDLHDFAQRTIGERLRQADVAPLLARVVRAASQSGEADALIDRIIGLAETWLSDNRHQVDRMVHERSHWWIPKSVDRRVANALVGGVIDVLHRLREPESETRAKFRLALAALADGIEQSPTQREQINAAKNRFLDDPEIQAWIGSLWSQLANAVIEDSTSANSVLRDGLARGLASLGRALEADEAMQGHVDSAIERGALRLMDWRGEIGKFIADVVSSWDTRTLSQRLELVVGSDLQYIRMNGTIVGALAGCVIFLLSQPFA
ncbi:MAG: DUF445 domain-containing protein [Bauldia sp.]|nr:DUF445 domain-containing protein [Bauldia sp.]